MKPGALALLWGLSVGLPGAAQEQPAPPVFRADVDVVAVDVNVVDGTGRPLRDLAPEDFALAVDGRPRHVLSADFVDLGSPDLPAPRPAPAGDVTTNEGASRGRMLLIVVDEGNIRPGSGRHVIASADRLLDALGPEDQAGLLTLPGGGPQVDLTTEHVRVRNALKLVKGRARFAGRRVSLTEAIQFDEGRLFDWEGVLRRECGTLTGLAYESCKADVEGDAGSVAQGFRHQSDMAMRQLLSLVETLRQIDGPKTVVLMTQALRSEALAELRQLAVGAAAARVAFYGVEIDDAAPDASIQLQPTTGFEDTDLLTRDLYRLASLSRGEVFRSAGSAGPFERITREMSGYYLIGFEPEGADRDGKDHVIAVSVRKPGATVRARRSLPFVPQGSAKDAREGLAAALKSASVATELPLRVATYALKDPSAPGKVRVLVSAEIGRGDVRAAGLSVGFAMADATGKVVASGAHRLGPEAAAESGGIPYLDQAVVDPGLYTLRLAAIDARGRRGSLSHAVKAALTTAGELEMADLMLAPPAERPGATLRPGVEARGDGDALLALVELYGPESALAAAKVTVEVAARDSGPALLEAPSSLAAGEGSRRTAQGLVPLALLPPGPYVARAVLAVRGRPTGQVTRSFRVSALAAGGPRPAPLSGFVPESVRFDLASLLAPELLRPSLERLRGMAGSLPAAVARALDEAEAGRLDSLADDLREGQASSLALSFLRGVGLLARGQAQGASTLLRAAMRDRPDFVPATIYLGAAAAAQGRDREAAGAWTTALAQDERAPVVPLALADAYLRLGEPADALEVLEQARTDRPDDVRLRDRLGLAYALAGRAAEALPLLEARLQRDPGDRDARFAVVRLLYEPIRTGGPAADRAGFERHARAYVEARGPRQALVAEWLRAMEAGAR